MDNLDKLEFLYKEIEYAKSQLQPQDTGHINTAISWLQRRVEEVKKDIRDSQYKNPVRRVGGNPPHQGII
jgi:hypothetical protein